MKHGTHRALIVLAGSMLALAASPAQANIVNVTSVISVEAEEGLSGSLTGAVDFRRGRITRLILSASPLLRYRAGEHLLIAYGVGEYDEDNDAVRKIFGHGRYRYALNPWLTAEVFTQHETNPGIGRAYRGLAGVGPLFELVEGDALRVSVGTAYMLEYERVSYDCPVDVPGCDEDPGLQHRLSVYATGSYALQENLQLVETVYLQPSILDPTDVRLLNDTQLSVLVTKFLAFNTTLSLAYDRAPNPTVIDRRDITLISSVTLQF